ncbi:hypothetical protein HPB52_011397 [Rhipicephalus sanguineus]|uniref:Uncharacterized protein n=1 Tax=Rhipicephalus sanguineus TaxID=34632 RepID=A0A9D4PVY2_RHISA|nr:hypothetical protein HPB52_011397 [Rhipicephalus sanguineus]
MSCLMRCRHEPAPLKSEPEEIYGNITNKTGPLQKFLLDITNHTMQCCQKNNAGFGLGDWLTMLTTVVPGSVTRSFQSRVSIELTGTHTRGELVFGWMPYMLPEVTRNVTVIQELNSSMVNRVFQETFDPSSTQWRQTTSLR